MAVYNHYKRVCFGGSDGVELQKSNVLLLGPTGVGKTELAKVLSKELFDSPETLIRLDMTEFTTRYRRERDIVSFIQQDVMSDILDVSLDYLAGKTEAPLERRIRKELEGSGLTQAQEDAVVEIALNSVPIIKRLG